MTLRGVKDEGSLAAKIVLIGEAPGLFVGASGHRLEVWWRKVGLKRSDFYITNVLPYMPKNIDRVQREEMETIHYPALRERLAKLQPDLLVPTGNYALHATTGLGKVSWHARDGRIERPGIMDWRGSILGADLNGRFVKVIPTIHPAGVLRTPGLERRMLADWKRIESDRHFTELRLPDYDIRIKPTLAELRAFVADALAYGKYLCLDIETPRGSTMLFQLESTKEWKAKVKKGEDVVRYKSGKKKGEPKTKKVENEPYIGCIGLAYADADGDYEFSLTVPTTLAYWKTEEALAEAKALVNQLLASNLEKIMQNGMFDASWLRRDGYTVRNWIWDTRAMHHALDPRDDHDLAYMASVLTRQPFWKHEAKDPDSVTKYASNSEALWTYNGIDVCVTFEIFFILLAELRKRKKLAFYRRHYANLMEPLLDMTMHGLGTDRDRMRSERKKLDARALVLAAEIETAAGLPLVAKTGLSNDRLKYLFYGAAGFKGESGAKKVEKLREKYPLVVPYRVPVQHAKAKRGEDPSATVNEVTVRKLILRFPQYFKILGPLLLEHRENRKQAEFLDISKCDPDGRMRCQFSFITEAGRLSSQENAWGTGRNLQNIDRTLRYVFVPD